MVFYLVYDGEVDPAAEAAAKAAADAAKAAELEKNKGNKVKFTPEQQEFMNSVVAEERRKLQAKNDQLITSLETAKNQSNTTAAQKLHLEERIETLRAEFATKEELNQRDTSKKMTELEKKLQVETARAETWQKRYDRDRMRTDLTQAAVSEKAFNANQVVQELRDSSRLIEILDDENKPTGEFETRVKIQTKDKDGKPVVLDLSPVDAVKQLKEDPDRFGNLFITSASGGLGGGNNNRGGAKPEKHLLGTNEYIAERRKERAAGNNRRVGK